MEKKEVVENTCKAILLKLSQDLNAQTPDVLNIKELKGKIEELFDKGVPTQELVNTLYPDFRITILNQISLEFKDEGFSERISPCFQKDGPEKVDEGCQASLNCDHESMTDHMCHRSNVDKTFPCKSCNCLSLDESKLSSDAQDNDACSPFLNDAVLQQEADSICKVLPYFDKNDVHHRLSLYISHSNRKSEVLQYFIELASEKGHFLSDDVFHCLTRWQQEPSRDLNGGPGNFLNVPDRSSFSIPDLSKENIGSQIDLKQLRKKKIEFVYEIMPSLDKSDITRELDDCTSEGQMELAISRFLENSWSDSKNKDKVSLASDSNTTQTGEGSLTKKDISTYSNCEIFDVDDSKPPVIDLEDSNSSPSSDVVLVDEIMSPKSENSSIPLSIEDSKILDDKYKSKSDPEAAVWEEAQAICELLPFLQLADVHQSIMDNYFHPNRKCVVLNDYFVKALEESYHIDSSAILNVLEVWKTYGKRPLEDSQGTFSSKRIKYGINTDPEQPIPSTSQLPVQLSEPPPLQPAPVPNSEWYKLKVEFLSETLPSVPRNLIESQVSNCFTEADILHLSTRLIEEYGSMTTTPLKPSTPPPSSSGTFDLNKRSPKNDFVKIEALDDFTQDEPISISTHALREEHNSNPSSAADMEDRIQVHIQQLGEMFSDADPDFIAERATEVAGDPEKFYELVMELTKNHSYPKLEEYLKRQKRMEMRQKFIEGMSVEEFLQYFEDPEKVFCDTSKVMSELYCKNARAQLMKELPYHLSKSIDAVFKTHNSHYLPSLRALRDKSGARKTKRTVGGKQPGDLDDIFIKELCYAKMEIKIKEYHKQKDEDKKKSFQMAKEAGRLNECQCCFDDEILQEDMSCCDSQDSPHFFCNMCIKRYSEEQIGQGKLEFICLEGECKISFSLNTLKKLLKPSIFSNLLKRKQAEEIAAAEIEDLESCPFCNFATIMPNMEDKVFKCLNPECLKDSCRLCKEPNHIPLRCEEIEKKKQTEARTYLENEMTEAMVRECYKCKKRYIKEEGCNKMQCSCGALMCYLCKKPIKGYDHFKSDSTSSTKINDGKCPLWSNSLKLHAEEVQQRAQQAKDKLDPKIELVHDPTTDLPQIPDYLKKSNKDRDPTNPPVNRHNFEHNLNGVAYHGDFLADLDNYRVQRHTHRHRHHHFYIPMQHPHLIQVPPPAHLPPPPAHLPPPPPAHQRQLQPPHFNLNMGTMDAAMAQPLLLPMAAYPPPRQDLMRGQFNQRPLRSPHLGQQQQRPLDQPIQLHHSRNHPLNPPPHHPPPPYHHHHPPPPLHQPASPWQPHHRRMMYNNSQGHHHNGGAYNDHRDRHRHLDNHNHMPNMYQSPNRHRDQNRF